MFARKCRLSAFKDLILSFQWWFWLILWLWSHGKRMSWSNFHSRKFHLYLSSDFIRYIHCVCWGSCRCDTQRFRPYHYKTWEHTTMFMDLKYTVEPGLTDILFYWKPVMSHKCFVILRTPATILYQMMLFKPGSAKLVFLCIHFYITLMELFLQKLNFILLWHLITIGTSVIHETENKTEVSVSIENILKFCNLAPGS